MAVPSSSARRPSTPASGDLNLLDDLTDFHAERRLPAFRPIIYIIDLNLIRFQLYITLCAKAGPIWSPRPM